MTKKERIKKLEDLHDRILQNNETGYSCVIQVIDVLIDMNKPARSRFVPPVPEEVEEEGKGLGYDVDGEKFCEFYGSKGWMVGKSKMKNWVMALNRACKDGWCLRTKKKESPLEEMQRKQKEYLG